jgi:hypothetical protein
MAVWCVTRHADVVAGLRDKRFSVDSRNREGGGERSLGGHSDSMRPSALTAWFRKQESTPLARFYNNAMLFLDPPRHPRLRRLLASSFDPVVMRQWRGTIEDSVAELLSEMRLRRDPDVIRDFALPLPTTIIARMIGIPREDVPMLRRWSYDLTQSFDPIISSEVFQRAERTATDFMQYIREHVDRRRDSPVAASDLLSRMSEAEMDGDRLSMDELVANCILLFVAGFETTTNVIGNGLLALLKNPDELELLRGRPELIEGAVEELLRYDGTFGHVYRTALEDVEMGGKVVKRGDPVLFIIPAANRDPDVFPDPDRLDLTRNAKSHLAFGHGAHYCLGASLGRLEAQIAILAAVQGLPDLRLVPGGTSWRKSLSLRGLDKLRVAFG